MNRLEKCGICHIMEWHTQLSQEKFESSSTVMQNLVEHLLTNNLLQDHNKSAGWCFDQVQRGTHCIYG